MYAELHIDSRAPESCVREWRLNCRNAEAVCLFPRGSQQLLPTGNRGRDGDERTAGRRKDYPEDEAEPFVGESTFLSYDRRNSPSRAHSREARVAADTVVAVVANADVVVAAAVVQGNVSVAGALSVAIVGF